MKKILLSSDCHGNFEKLFTKVRQLHSKNNFDMMLMTGRVCVAQSSQSFKKIANEQIKVPIPTYFIDCSQMSGIFGQAYPQGKQIAPNFIFLGKMGIKMIQGIKVCYVNGQDISQNQQRYQKIYNGSIQNNVPRESFEKFISRLQYKGSDFTQPEISQLIQSHQSNSFNSIDILLTNQWPSEFEHPNMIEVSKSKAISQVCYELSPKYHLVASGVQYFRKNPFKNKKNESVTHFINVAEIQPNCKQLPKDKYLVAIQIDPMSTKNNAQNVEECPFSQQTQKAQHKNMEDQDPEQSARNLQFISSNQDRIKEIIEKKKTKKKQETKKQLNPNSYIYFEGFPQEVSDRQISQFLERWGPIKELQVDKKSNNKLYRTGICRFRDVESTQICLSDSNRYTLYQSRIKFSIKQQNQKYRVENCYLCVDKPNFDESLVVYIGQFCYIAIDKGPIEKYHFQIVPINHVSNSRQLEDQEKKQINSLKQMLIQSAKSQKLTLLSYERYANLSYEINHCIIHCIPIDMTEQMMVDRLVNVNISNRYRLVENREGQTLTPKKGNQTQFYIKMSISNKQFIKYLQRKDKDLQLSRQIICQIIQKPEKLNWRDCIISPRQIAHSIEFVRKLIKNV